MAIDFYPKPRSFFSSESQPWIRALLQIRYGRRAVAKHEAKAEWAENSCERGHEQLPIFDIAKNKTKQNISEDKNTDKGHAAYFNLITDRLYQDRDTSSIMLNK